MAARDSHDAKDHSRRQTRYEKHAEHDGSADRLTELRAQIGRTLWTYRTFERGKMTQRALAEPKYTQSQISAIERGKVFPSFEALLYFADKLDVDVSVLLCEINGPGRQKKRL